MFLVGAFEFFFRSKASAQVGALAFGANGILQLLAIIAAQSLRPAKAA